MPATPAIHTTPSPVRSIAANGTVTITKSYDEPNHRGIIPSAVTITCTQANPVTIFAVNCGRNGSATATIPTAPQAQVSCTVSTNGVNTLTLSIVQGSSCFTPNSVYTFALQCDFDGYWYSLAAPDGFEGWSGDPMNPAGRVSEWGRSSVIIATPNDVTPTAVE